MASMRVSCSGEIVSTPPRLPDYLLAAYNPKPIVGKPADEDVQTIHAVVRALNGVAHVPTLYNPDLSMKLSQHLFGVQMGMYLRIINGTSFHELYEAYVAIYRANYSGALLPGDMSVYIPPALPSHIPGTLNQVVGAPSDEEIKLAQGALRSVENLAISPQLFDANLSMRLSQHVFNLQFARYMHDSAAGRFVSETEPEEHRPVVSQTTQEAPEHPTVAHELPNLHNEGRNISPIPAVEQAPQEPSDIAELGETIVKAIKEATSETKDVLENMNRVITLIKRDQSTVGCTEKYYQVFKNPLNQQGVAASLRYEYIDDGYRYHLWMNTGHIAGYLRFFGIGADLIQGGDEPKLIDGKETEAGNLILAQLGVTRP
ncbi:unnamed protein product [Rhizoctonia solani]|uniref:Laminin domain protein n=1 Tax=Rhizoctonia solani TaxID=456999 RepID=A0A8H3GYU8_9AGAM|nr:unnamed protein product [Rhizoctonia solani]